MPKSSTFPMNAPVLSRRTRKLLTIALIFVMGYCLVALVEKYPNIWIVYIVLAAVSLAAFLIIRFIMNVFGYYTTKILKFKNRYSSWEKSEAVVFHKRGPEFFGKLHCTIVSVIYCDQNESIVCASVIYDDLNKKNDLNSLTHFDAVSHLKIDRKVQIKYNPSDPRQIMIPVVHMIDLGLKGY